MVDAEKRQKAIAKPIKKTTGRLKACRPVASLMLLVTGFEDPPGRRGERFGLHGLGNQAAPGSRSQMHGHKDSSRLLSCA